ncbi:efflux transporter periplasmic adaptor subunit, partial [Bacteroides nordii]|nr:efflux transporter periplasmic adaptor subunit [Bacteroides nordii]
MRLFLSKKDLKLKKSRTIATVVCIVLILGSYWLLTRPHKAETEIPTVIVEAAGKEDVEIYGEYVGRIR